MWRLGTSPENERSLDEIVCLQPRCLARKVAHMDVLAKIGAAAGGTGKQPHTLHCSVEHRVSKTTALTIPSTGCRPRARARERATPSLLARQPPSSMQRCCVVWAIRARPLRGRALPAQGPRRYGAQAGEMSMARQPDILLRKPTASGDRDSAGPSIDLARDSPHEETPLTRLGTASWNNGLPIHRKPSEGIGRTQRRINTMTPA